MFQPWVKINTYWVRKFWRGNLAESVRPHGKTVCCGMQPCAPRKY